MPPPHAPSAQARESGENLDTVCWLKGFVRNCELHPSRPAVISGEREVSYRQLAAQAGRIATMLRHAGIGRGCHVGAGFHRSTDLIAGLLGILQTGAAYIPLDPAYPEARISRMIESAGLSVVLTSAAFSGCFPGARVLLIEDAQPFAEADGFRIEENDPVYAIFTSGSTGLPKAASVFHAGFANLLEWYREELVLGTDDRTLVISSPSFDLTQKNLFTPLLTGGTLVLDDCHTYDITRILGLIRRHAVTLINCTPSAFYPLVDAAAIDGFRDIASLRFAVLGGEPISIPRLRNWFEHPSCRAEVVNSYGPTECTDICLFHRLRRGNLDDFPFVPLGREIPNVSVSIRDENLELLPDGETGELCIGGAGVGGGYLNDPARTGDRFVNGMYRSGDLAKRHRCGTYEFRGRADHQVKVNGFRIELGEIEIALNGHDFVREAVVTSSDNKLTAHITGTATAQDLRVHLASRLPAYMIPADFRFLHEFPLTPNGKVDRKALCEAVTLQPAGEFRTPDRSLESDILSLWSEILGHPVSDPSANFFDIGGNSIHLAVVHVRLREMTGLDFPITDLFALPSARAIAVQLGTNQPSAPPQAALDRARLAKAGLARFQRTPKR